MMTFFMPTFSLRQIILQILIFVSIKTNTLQFTSCNIECIELENKLNRGQRPDKTQMKQLVRWFHNCVSPSISKTRSIWNCIFCFVVVFRCANIQLLIYDSVQFRNIEMSIRLRASCQWQNSKNQLILAEHQQAIHEPFTFLAHLWHTLSLCASIFAGSCLDTHKMHSMFLFHIQRECLSVYCPPPDRWKN